MKKTNEEEEEGEEQNVSKLKSTVPTAFAMASLASTGRDLSSSFIFVC